MVNRYDFARWKFNFFKFINVRIAQSRIVKINAAHSVINILKGKLAILSDSALSPKAIQNIIGIINS